MAQDFPPLKNDLLLRALKGGAVSRPPVWMMRQAGRYLPDFQKLRERYSFFERAQNPELVTEITLMPVEQVGVDAAIIFSDILVIPQAFDFEVTIKPGEGVRIHNPLRTVEHAESLRLPDVKDRLHYVFDSLTKTREALNGRVPLIGFAGAPWTLLCYMIEGNGSATFHTAKSFCFTHFEAVQAVLEKLTEATIAYLHAQVDAGAQVVQVFDSWAGLLGPSDFQNFCLPYLERICASLAPRVPVILFAKGAWYALDRLGETDAACIGLDWTVPPPRARQLVGGKKTLQGNLDPARLLSPPKEIRRRTNVMIRNFGTQKYIVNLGHGILPNVPVDNARVFVDTVKAYED